MKPYKINTSLLVTTAITLLLTLSAIAQKKGKEKELDKKTLLIEFTEDGKKKSTPDELSFAGNKMKSKFFSEKQFTPATYEVTVDSTSEERTISFEATLVNKSEEELVWTGTLKEEEVEGTAVWSKKGKVKKEYTFSGTLKQKKK